MFTTSCAFYPVNDEHLSATEVANAIRNAARAGFQDARCAWRSCWRGPCTCIPANAELGLKALAAASDGNKKVELVAMKEVLGLTGYVRGGVSPVGTRKPYPLYIDETADIWDTISVERRVFAAARWF